MNIGTIIAIILFLVLRAAFRVQKQVQQENGRKKNGAPPLLQQIDWESLSPRQEEAALKKSGPARTAVQESPVLPVVPEFSQQPSPDAEYKLAGEDDSAAWFAGPDDLRRAVVNSEILSRKFDL